MSRFGGAPPALRQLIPTDEQVTDALGPTPR